MDTLGIRLIRSVLNEKDFSTLTKVGVTDQSVFDDSRTAFKWIFDYSKRA